MSAAYAEVVHWRRNSFLVPYGNVGKQFVTELVKLYRAYAEGSAMEAIALTATIVMSILLLQKPHPSSKPRDHTVCLERCLKAWCEGDINSLVIEGRTIQKRLPKPKVNNNHEEKLALSFLRLMFQGKTKAALQLLIQHGKEGILHFGDTVSKQDTDPATVLDVLKLGCYSLYVKKSLHGRVVNGSYIPQHSESCSLILNQQL